MMERRIRGYTWLISEEFGDRSTHVGTVDIMHSNH